MFCTRCNLILQASVCPLVCVPEEYTIRGEVRREEVADLLAAVIQALVLQQPLMAASLGPGHAQAVARAGRNVENFYILLLDDAEIM